MEVNRMPPWILGLINGSELLHCKLELTGDNEARIRLALSHHL